jgi:hypothetical protein
MHVTSLLVNIARTFTLRWQPTRQQEADSMAYGNIETAYPFGSEIKFTRNLHIGRGAYVTVQLTGWVAMHAANENRVLVAHELPEHVHYGVKSNRITYSWVAVDPVATFGLRAVA